MINFADVTLSFDGGHTHILKNFNLSINKGETVVLLGTSGCGKTTCLKLINRLINPTAGQVTVDGVNVQEQDPVQLRRSIGYVFQEAGLFPHLNVLQNLTIVLKLLKVPKPERVARSKAMLHLVGLDPDIFAKRSIAELSGGQQQRVGVARALMNQPHILLMDEPFAALDPLTRYELQTEIIRLKNQLHKTVVFVTHDIVEAFRLADRIVVMNQGVIEQLGSKHELIHQPKSAFVRELIANQKQQLQFMNQAMDINND